MRHGLNSGMVLTAGLLAACATGSQEVRDEGSERIEEAMRPEPHPEVIPEGIALGSDAPPLAPPGPEVVSSRAVGIWNEGPLFPGWFRGPLPVVGRGPVWGAHPGTVRYHIQATPGGSIPGLLP